MSTAQDRLWVALKACRPFDGTRHVGNGKPGGFKAHCPVHKDPQVSLSVWRDERGAIAVHCLAGCESGAVIEALGFERRDIHPDADSVVRQRRDRSVGPVAPRPDPKARPAPRPDAQLERGRDHVHIDTGAPVRYACSDPDGTSWSHVRTDGCCDTKRMWWEPSGPGSDRRSYLPRPLPTDLADPVYVTEGEKPADALAALGSPVVGLVGGASSTPGEGTLRHLFTRRQVILLPDHDEPGAAFMGRVAAGLASIATRIQVLTPDPAWPRGTDVADLAWPGETAYGLHLLANGGGATAGDRQAAAARLTQAMDGRVAEVSTAHRQKGIEKVEDVATGGWPGMIELAPIEPLPTFPLDTLPAEAADLVASVAEATETDPSMGAAMVLGVLGAVIGHRVTIDGPNRVWTEHGLHAWVVIPALSGAGKTEVSKHITGPLRDLDRKARANDGAAEGKKQAMVTAQQLRITRMKKASGKEEDSAEVVEVVESALVDAMRVLDDLKRAAPSESFLLSDASPEAIVRKMGENMIGRVVLMSDESDVLSTLGGNRYNTNPLIGPVLAGFSSKESQHVERITRATIDIEYPSVAIITSCQPRTVFDARRNGLLDQRGFSARVLWCWPEERAGTRHLAGRAMVPTQHHERWARLIRDLDELVTNVVPSQPVQLRLDDEATALFVEWHDDRLEPQRHPVTGDLSTTDGLFTWAQRAHGLALRVAGALFLARVVGKGAWAPVVPVTDVENAIRIVDGFAIDHARSTFGVPRTDPVGLDALRLRSWYRQHRHSEFTIRDANRSLSDWGPDRVRAAARRLEEHAYVRVLGKVTTEKGGRPSEPVMVNPADVPDPEGGERNSTEVFSVLSEGSTDMRFQPEHEVKTQRPMDGMTELTKPRFWDGSGIDWDRPCRDGERVHASFPVPRSHPRYDRDVVAYGCDRCPAIGRAS